MQTNEENESFSYKNKLAKKKPLLWKKEKSNNDL